MKKLIIFLVCSTVLALSGCANEQRTREYVQTGTESVNQISKSIIGAKRAELAEDPGILDAYEKDIDDVMAQQRTLFAKLKEEIEEEKRQREALVSALGSIAIEALPAGSSAIQVAKAVGFKIDTAADKAIETANAKTEGVEMTANDNKEKIAALTGTTDGIARNIGNIEDKLDKIDVEVGELKKDKITKDIDLALAKKALESLDPAIQDKLRNVPENVIVELTKLKADDAAFREKFQRELQLTDEQMESLKGLTTDKLIALLVATGAATGAGGLTGKAWGRASGREAAKTGPSRGAEDIDVLRKEIARVERKIPK